ncbi:hypothetical protein AC623_09910 [Bacillus sp. FJAT-27231]|uniref:S-layer homology domain-containing protein n=1 Tax=Bacillus sp. FJAT-27231 TaxID=1679168 RepID=UPI0006717F31|nr:S-layer homology domain-containing protein [Bacillus sp. FJAT-27231]KMY54209.1 hypothetical protein AC623_09910 [Bacillus sp. FJAT-27231]
MKKMKHSLIAASLAGILCSIPADLTEAANFNPVLAQPASTFPFKDVPVQYKETVSALYQNKFLNGVSEDAFGWGLLIKRVDAAVIVARGIGFRKSLHLPGERSTFQDIPDRAKDEISYLQFYRIIQGKTDIFFGSNDVITRGEAAIILSRAYYDVLSSPDETVHQFTDATGRYATAINRLAASGITNGKSLTKFGTNDPVTRGEFAVMTARLSDPALSPSSYGDLPSSRNGLTIKTEKESYSLSSDTAVSIVLVNTADFDYASTREYILEKKQGDKWLQIKYNLGTEFLLDLPPIEAGESKKVTLSFDRFRTLMTAGKYRVRHTFGPAHSEGKEEPVRIAAEFTLTE